ncbi:hypothetical protein IFM89_039916 [Coptis chinensis]|uniref:FAR1 domain-containing protein n=1 Tax=Coptis chinensis TaxID=261450 RepID=A0A835LBY2_9MAGN|nr:hypothetical protein IFM89_039916 [Coptis chinensis]
MENKKSYSSIDLNKCVNELDMEDNEWSEYQNGVTEDEDAVEKKINEPEVGMEFENIDTLKKIRSLKILIHLQYGNKKGFPVKIRSSKKGSDGVVRWVAILCAQEGKYRTTAKNSFKLHSNCKIGYKAMIRVSLSHEGKWRVSSLFLKCNHDMIESRKVAILQEE